MLLRQTPKIHLMQIVNDRQGSGLMEWKRPGRYDTFRREKVCWILGGGTEIKRPVTVSDGFSSAWISWKRGIIGSGAACRYIFSPLTDFAQHKKSISFKKAHLRLVILTSRCFPTHLQMLRAMPTVTMSTTIKAATNPVAATAVPFDSDLSTPSSSTSSASGNVDGDM